MKKILLIITFVLVLLAIPLTVFLVKQQQDLRQRASPATTLYFDPATVTKNPDQTFTLNVMIDTAENQITQIGLNITYDPTYLEAVSIENGTFLPNVIESGKVGGGVVTMTLAATPTAPKQGTGTVAVVTFKTLVIVDTTSVRFGSSTRVQPLGDTTGTGNVLIGTQPATITIGTGAKTQSGGFATTSTSSTSSTPSSTPSISSPSPKPSATPPGVPPNVNPSSSPSSSPVTHITTPVNNSTVTIKRPTIAGTSFPSAQMILSLNTTPVTSSSFAANSAGNWSYIPTSDLSNATYTVTVTGKNATTNVTETATSLFTVAAGGTGGGGASSSASPRTSATPLASSRTSTSSSIPVTGTTSVTIILLGLSLGLFSISAWTLRKS